MDAPIARLMSISFCTCYEKQAKKEEEESVEFVNAINASALEQLCTRFDNEYGEFPEHQHEGMAVLKFFEELKDSIGKGKKQGIPVNIRHVTQAYDVDMDEFKPGVTYPLAKLMDALGFMNAGRPKCTRRRNKH